MTFHLQTGEKGQKVNNYKNLDVSSFIFIGKSRIHQEDICKVQMSDY